MANVLSIHATLKIAMHFWVPVHTLSNQTRAYDLIRTSAQEQTR